MYEQNPTLLQLVATMSSSMARLHRIFTQPSTPKTPTFKALMENLFKEKNLSKLVQNFKNLSETPRFRSRHRIYEDTVRRLASSNKFSLIEELLEHQKKYEDITKEGFAVRLIGLYGKVGMFEHAFKVFDEMPAFKCERTVKSFNVLLKACVVSKHFDKAEKLFKELPSSLSITPDERSHNIVIQALCEMGSLDSANSMLDEMESNGVKPSLITFNTVMNEFYSNGRFSDGERIWAKMIESDIVPDLISFNAKLAGLLHGGKISEAEKVIEELKRRELKLDIITYNTLIRWYCNDGNVDEAKRLYDHLLENDFVPNRVTFQALIPCIYEKGDLELALKLCEKSVNSYCFIDVGILQLVVDGLVKEAQIEEAENLVKLARSKKYGRSSLKMPSYNE